MVAEVQFSGVSKVAPASKNIRLKWTLKGQKHSVLLLRRHERVLLQIIVGQGKTCE